MSGTARHNAGRPAAPEVAAMLAQAIERLAPELLSAGRLRGGYWTVGSVDNEPGQSMWVHLRGSRAGRWRDAATGEAGDALDLVAATRCRGDLRAAYAWALGWLGLEGARPAPAAPVRAATLRPAPAVCYDGRERAARRIWLTAAPSLAGTPAAAYLAGRGIDLAAMGRQPSALRCHPRLMHTPSGCAFPALVAAIASGTGAHVATHRIWLAQRGGGWGKAPVDPVKMVLGDYAGCSIRIWRGSSGRPFHDADPDEPVVVGEGIETCLSIALAVPEYRVLCAVSLSNMGSIVLPPQVRRVILAADNDVHPRARAEFARVASVHRQAGREVSIARSEIGSDFNDALRAWA